MTLDMEIFKLLQSLAARPFVFVLPCAVFAFSQPALSKESVKPKSFTPFRLAQKEARFSTPEGQKSWEQSVESAQKIREKNPAHAFVNERSVAHLNPGSSPREPEILYTHHNLNNGNVSSGKAVLTPVKADAKMEDIVVHKSDTGDLKYIETKRSVSSADSSIVINEQNRPFHDDTTGADYSSTTRLSFIVKKGNSETETVGEILDTGFQRSMLLELKTRVDGSEKTVRGSAFLPDQYQGKLLTIHFVKDSSNEKLGQVTVVTTANQKITFPVEIKEDRLVVQREKGSIHRNEEPNKNPLSRLTVSVKNFLANSRNDRASGAGANEAVDILDKAGTGSR